MSALVTTRQQAALLVERVGRAEVFGLDTESSGPNLLSGRMLNVHRSELTGISLAFPDGEAFYVPVAHYVGNLPYGEVVRIQEAILDARGRVWVHNAKHEAHVFHQEGLDLSRARVHDSLLCHWLLDRRSDSKKSPFGLKALAHTYLQREAAAFESVARGRQWRQLPPAEALSYACGDARNTLELGERLLPELSAFHLTDTLLQTEVPFAFLLAEMERRGMAIDAPALLELADRLEVRMRAIEDEWAWEWPRVSIASPQQVGNHFYGNRLWPTRGVGRTKKTNRLKVDREAMELALAHPRTPPEGRRAAELRVEYQDAHKIVSTYSRTLVAQASQYQDGRLHPNAMQHGTVTGRISMSDPNLQNIPVRSALGKEVKRCFVPGPGNLFVSADYSQIELRVLAHFAPAGALFRAYATNVDIHQQTADLVGTTRDRAKTLNFAYVYGARPKKLAKTLGVDLDEAQRIYDGFEAAYPEVVDARNRAIARATETGCIRTLGGNVRRLPGITSPDWKVRAAAERLALNTPVQGSAAYVVKRGMLYAAHAGLHIVGQVHDEVLCEEAVFEAGACAGRLRRALEGAVKLRVPLVAEPKTGADWLQTK